MSELFLLISWRETDTAKHSNYHSDALLLLHSDMFHNDHFVNPPFYVIHHLPPNSIQNTHCILCKNRNSNNNNNITFHSNLDTEIQHSLSSIQIIAASLHPQRPQTKCHYKTPGAGHLIREHRYIQSENVNPRNHTIFKVLKLKQTTFSVVTSWHSLTKMTSNNKSTDQRTESLHKQQYLSQCILPLMFPLDSI